MKIDWLMVLELNIILAICSYLGYQMGYEKAESKYLAKERKTRPYDYEKDGIW